MCTVHSVYTKVQYIGFRKVKDQRRRFWCVRTWPYQSKVRFFNIIKPVLSRFWYTKKVASSFESYSGKMAIETMQGNMSSFLIIVSFVCLELLAQWISRQVKNKRITTTCYLGLYGHRSIYYDMTLSALDLRVHKKTITTPPCPVWINSFNGSNLAQGSAWNSSGVAGFPLQYSSNRVYTVPNVVDFPRNNTKCCEENDILRGIWSV